MQLKLGFSTGLFWTTIPSMNERVQNILKFENTAIEVGVHKLESLTALLTEEPPEIFENLKKFEYRSIHAMVRDMRYPCDDTAVSLLLELAGKMGAHTIVFHPDIVDDFTWIGATFGKLSAFENMDKNKKFGREVGDLEKVFEQSPVSKFVFDANHLYTNDPEMKDAAIFHEKFGDRLCHYHLSGYGGNYHGFLHETGEDSILAGIRNLNVPIIHEGVLDSADNYELTMSKERDYIAEGLGILQN